MRYKYRKLILYITTGIMGLGLATFTFSSVPSSKEPPVTGTFGAATGKPSETPVQPSVTPPLATATVSPTPTPTPLPNNLEYDAYPAINELITSFMNAKLDSTSTFEDLVLNAAVIDLEKYQRKTEYIKAYHNIHCYTKRGINEINYVVYLIYDAELPTIETYAPSIEELYVTKDKEGRMWIYFGEISEETQEYISTLREDTEVKALIQKVNEAFTKALKEDSSLNEFFKNLTSAPASDSK